MAAEQAGAWQRAAKMVKEGTVPAPTPAGVAGFGVTPPAAGDDDSTPAAGSVTKILDALNPAKPAGPAEPEDLIAAGKGTGSSAGDSDAEGG